MQAHGTDEPSTTEHVTAFIGRATVVWDFDGVLMDSEDLHRISYTTVAAELGHTLTARDYRRLAGNTEEHNWGVLLDDGLDAAPASFPALMTARRRVFEELAGDASPTWLARDVVSRLGARAEQYVVSNNDSGFVRAVLARWGALDQLRVVERPAHLDKSLLLERFRRHTDLVVVDDSRRYVELGRSFGARTIGVRHTGNDHVDLPADLLVTL